MKRDRRPSRAERGASPAQILVAVVVLAIVALVVVTALRRAGL